MEHEMITSRINSLPVNERYIIAIGASAGGLEAIHEFFDNMPSNGNFSFVIIQHLSPDYKSLLVELVSKHTNMKVFEARHNAEIEPNCVYVIPNDKLLTINHSRLQLSDKNFEKAPNTAIDTFLKSLAEDHGSKAIAVILSGTGTDGTRGIQAIQNAGGMVLVQDPLTAKFDGMPNSAIATGYADYILAPELMPEEIFNYIKERPIRIATEGSPDESLLPEVLKLIEKHCQYDFHNYKTPTILRRIGRRMGQLGFKVFQEYIEYLRESSEECRILGREFLIGVTKFFRDNAAFNILKTDILPEIIQSKNTDDVLKIWVAACSTGEEAYSMAIMVDDILQSMNKSLEVKIFATDIDIESIEIASKGIYPGSSVIDIDDDLVQRYFNKEGNNVIIHPSIRKQIVFAKHNILKDPPFIKNDLISCRNMLIYMNNILQRKVLSTLQFSLNTGGYLFLGPSEIPASIKDSFEEINNKWKFYRKVSNDTRFNAERFPSTHSLKHQRDARLNAKENYTVKELEEDFKNLLTKEYGYAAVYVDRNLEIKEGIGDFKKYLMLPEKLSNFQILKMVSEDLSLALNTAIRKAKKENTKITLNNVRVKSGDKDRLINLFVRPSSKDGFMLIVFEERHEIHMSKPLPEFTSNNSPESIQYISELEEELKETRVNLQMAIEGLETANEELQSSNEELLSANEELQSSNEELQSLNEELHTLNTEHQLRIKELIELNDDLNNYFRSSQIAQIFLDKEMQIRKFNPVAVKMVNVIESDIGRPIDHISNNLNNYNLIPDIQQALEKEVIIEKEITLASGNIALMRILPYLRQDKHVDGVVITFVDISRVKELDNIIKSVFNSSLSAIMAFKTVRNQRHQVEDFICITLNERCKEILNQSFSQFIGKSFKADLKEFADKGIFEKCVSVVNTGVPSHSEIQLNNNEKDIWYDLIINQMEDGFVITLTNINEKKIAEEKFRQNFTELVEIKENYRNLNSALEEKVKDRTRELTQTEERFRLIANATNDAVWDWDLVNNKIWWSDSFYSRFGFTKNEEAATSNFWLDHIHPDDKARVNKNIQDAIESDTGWSGRYRFRNASGSYSIILDRGKVLKDADGHAFRIVGAMMDVTEKERAEEQLSLKNEELQFLIEEFKFVTDFMPQIVWSALPDGFHDFFNKRWYDYTGLKFEDSKGKGWLSVIHPDDAEKALAAWNQSLKTGSSYEVEYRMRSKDRGYRWFLARAIPLKPDNSRLVKWFGTCTDIHDQKLASDILEQKVRERTEELQRINIELESSNNELLQFASVASHDLKEPLRKIHMFSNLVKDRYLENIPGATDYMNRIIGASARMTKLINDLLTFTRLSISTTFEIADLNTVIEEVLSDLELSILEKQATIEVGELPKIEIITGQMRQVFQNIISNSLKFCRKEEHPRISIYGELIDECAINASKNDDGEYCRITIKDNGIGFDNFYSSKIFTIFQRLHPREKYDGTGIGLAITKKIIEKHNGIITAEGKENEGAKFVIVLPLKQGVEEIAVLNN